MQRQIRFLMLAALAAMSCSKEKEKERVVAPPHAPAVAPKPPAPNREEHPEYLVEIAPPAAAAAGEERTAQVYIAGRGGYHVNAEYPLAFTPDAVEGLRFKDQRLALSESAQKTPCFDKKEDTCELRAKVPFIADKPAKLSGTLAFSVCQAERCLIEKARLVVNVPVR